jgi:hypothetical protein
MAACWCLPNYFGPDCSLPADGDLFPPDVEQAETILYPVFSPDYTHDVRASGGGVIALDFAAVLLENSEPATMTTTTITTGTHGRTWLTAETTDGVTINGVTTHTTPGVNTAKRFIPPDTSEKLILSAMTTVDVDTTTRSSPTEVLAKRGISHTRRLVNQPRLQLNPDSGVDALSSAKIRYW